MSKGRVLFLLVLLSMVTTIPALAQSPTDTGVLSPPPGIIPGGPAGAPPGLTNPITPPPSAPTNTPAGGSPGSTAPTSSSPGSTATPSLPGLLNIPGLPNIPGLTSPAGGAPGGGGTGGGSSGGSGGNYRVLDERLLGPVEAARVRGRTLFNSKKLGQRAIACASCHLQEDLQAIARAYPRYNPLLESVATLEQAQNACIERYMEGSSIAPLSRNATALSLYLVGENPDSSGKNPANPE